MGKVETSIERVVIKELLKTEHRRGYTQIAVVDWVSDKTYRQLEKREYFVQEDGSQKMGKAKGFTRGDFALILGHAREIMELFGGNPVPAKNEPQNENLEAAHPSPSTPPARQDPF